MRYYTNKSTKERGTLANLQFTPTQEKEIIAVAGHLGLLLMERYIALATLTDASLEDTVLATMLSVTDRTVRSARTKLTKAGLFKRTKYSDHITYDIGRQAVQAKVKINVNLKHPLTNTLGK